MRFAKSILVLASLGASAFLLTACNRSADDHQVKATPQSEAIPHPAVRAQPHKVGLEELSGVAIAVGTSESEFDCLSKQFYKTRKRDDCYCAGYPAEKKRQLTQLAGVKVLAVTFHNATSLISGQGSNFGCWYQTDFKAPTGFKILGYQFQTVTGFGYCELRLNSPNGPNVQDMHGQHFQECGPQIPPDGGADVTLIYRLKGTEFSDSIGPTMNKDGGISIEETKSPYRNHGGFILTVYLTQV
jgi:hypothetical protein